MSISKKIISLLTISALSLGLITGCDKEKEEQNILSVYNVGSHLYNRLHYIH